MPDKEVPVRGVTWPQVVLTLGFTALFFCMIIVLAVLKQDLITVAGAIVVLLLTVLNVFGWQKQESIEKKVDRVAEVSNGRLTEQIESNQRLQAEIKALHLQMTEMALRMPAESAPPE